MAHIGRDVNEIVQELRMQLARRGEASINTLAKAFKINDRDGNNYFSLDEMEQILSRCGLFLKTHELKKLMKHFDINNDGRISYDEFLRGLQGRLNERRMNMIQLAFAKMDKTGDGVVDRRDVEGVYDASQHPKVISGEKTTAQVLEEFLKSFEGPHGNNDGQVTREEWLSYYTGISASFPYNDDYFVLVMEKCWGIQEDQAPMQRFSAGVLSGLKDQLIEKIRQKTTSSGNESMTLQRHFKFLDLDESGFIIFDEFAYGLQRFGFHLSESQGRALFAFFDKSNSGRISYAEFGQALFPQTEEVQDGNASSQATVVFVLGGPGSGKGTQCQKIVEEFGYVHLSAGDLLRTERDSGSSDGDLINSYIRDGKIVPVEITAKLLRNAIEANTAIGNIKFLVDGFPRNTDNLQGWNAIVGPLAHVACVLFFDCPETVMEQRLLDRGRTSGRVDDNLDSIRKRFAVFQEESMPVVREFANQNRCRTVDSSRQPEQVYEAVRHFISDI